MTPAQFGAKRPWRLLLVGLAVVLVLARTIPLRASALALVGLLLLAGGGYALYRSEWIGAIPDRSLLDRWSAEGCA